jgi:ATP-dependent DNA helicase DinG
MTVTADTAGSIRSWADAERRLAETLPGYESRPQQVALATAVEATLAKDKGNAVMAEAGCGTGKSIGGLVPAILSGERVIVATATKALMEQYAQKDVPFLQESLGVPFTWALLKGRSNYLCWAKANNADRNLHPWIDALMAEVAENDDHSGDREHFNTSVSQDQFRNVASTTDECPGKKDCPFGDICFAEKAKAKAAESRVVITNTAMLMTDLKIKDITDGQVAMLGEFEALLLDEAHELEEIATESLKDTLREGSYRRLGTEVLNFGKAQGMDLTRQVEEMEMASGVVWAALPKPSTTLGVNYFLTNEEPFTGLVDALRALGERVSRIDVTYGDKKTAARRQSLMSRCFNAANRLTDIMLGDDDSLIRWVDEERGKKIVVSAPMSVAPFLREWLWSQVTAVLMSATMSVGGKFDYMQERLGLEGCDTLTVGTPFDYNTQALLYVPDEKIPSPKERSAWMSVAPTLAMELIDAAGGGALVLCTSNESMNSLYNAVAPRLRAKGINVYKQHDEPNPVLARKFKEDTHSVLFGLKSFMTGFDAQGDTCRLVIVDKLPFAVPTDVVFQARAAYMDRKAGRSVSFRKLSIPSMTLTLNQAFGRLIRTQSDRGVVAILDSRLTATPWGRSIVSDLPDSPATTSLANAQGFYA